MLLELGAVIVTHISAAHFPDVQLLHQHTIRSTYIPHSNSTHLYFIKAHSQSVIQTTWIPSEGLGSSASPCIIVHEMSDRYSKLLFILLINEVIRLMYAGKPKGIVSQKILRIISEHLNLPRSVIHLRFFL